MNDKQLEFWTKPPNVFMVATTLIGKIVGCISYKQMTFDTVQMHRLRVDEKYRGQRIGRKLIQASLDTAKENGYNLMYLETGNPQFDAIRLYGKMNFEYLHDVPFPVEWPFLEFLSGLELRTYVRYTGSLIKE